MTWSLRTLRETEGSWAMEGSGQSLKVTAGFAAARISTTPLVPSMRIRSPFLICSVATDVPTTAGMPISREWTAGCETVPPASV